MTVARQQQQEINKINKKNNILFFIISTIIVTIPNFITNVIVPIMLICLMSKCIAVTKTTTHHHGVFRAARIRTTTRNTGSSFAWFNRKTTAHGGSRRSQHHHPTSLILETTTATSSSAMRSNRQVTTRATTPYLSTRSVSSISLSTTASSNHNGDCCDKNNNNDKNNKKNSIGNSNNCNNNNNNSKESSRRINSKKSPHHLCNKNTNIGTLVSRIIPKSLNEYNIQKPDEYKLNNQKTNNLLQIYLKDNENDKETLKAQGSVSASSSSLSSLIQTSRKKLCRVIAHPTSTGIGTPAAAAVDGDEVILSTDNNASSIYDNWIVSLNIDFHVKFNILTGKVIFDTTNTSCHEEENKGKNNSEEIHHLSIHMNRNANESAYRTIKRLEISAIRKIESEQRKLYRQRQQYEYEQYVVSSSSSSKPNDNVDNGENIRNGSGSNDGNGDDDEKENNNNRNENTKIHYYVPKKECNRNNQLRAETSIGSITTNTNTTCTDNNTSLEGTKIAKTMSSTQGLHSRKVAGGGEETVKMKSSILIPTQSSSMSAKHFIFVNKKDGNFSKRIERGSNSSSSSSSSSSSNGSNYFGSSTNDSTNSISSSNTSCGDEEGNGSCTTSSINNDDEDSSTDGYSTLKVSSLLTSTELFTYLEKAIESDIMTRNRSVLSLSLHALQQQQQQSKAGHDDDNNNSSSSSSSNRLLLKINSCPPTILSVKTFEQFESQVFVGVPLVIRTEVLHATNVTIVWFVNNVLVQRNSPCYTPSQNDIGKQISILIIPTRYPTHDGIGYEEAYYFKNVVEPLPYMPLISPLRDEWLLSSSCTATTPTASEVATNEQPEQQSIINKNGNLRVMTYNLLADLYTGREVDQQLMYCHCDPKFLGRCRRMPMLLYEILSYGADIICLQEVDAAIFANLLQPVLLSRGYQGFYSNKASSQLEGCAMFWSLQCFDYAKEDDMGTYSIRDLFGGGDDGSKRDSDDVEYNRKDYSKWDSMDNIDKMLDNFPELKKVTREKVGQVLQVATLTVKNTPETISTTPRKENEYHGLDIEDAETSKPNKIVVANTHLFYHPMANHIRAMQAYVVCKQIDLVRRRHLISPPVVSESNKGDGAVTYPYPLVFCGDLNSNPLSGAVHLLLQRRIGPDHFQTWKHLHEYEWGMGEYDFMIEHGYIGNYPEGATSNGNSNSSTSASTTSTRSIGDEYIPQYIEDEFHDAREYEEDSDDYNNMYGGGSGASTPPHIDLPTSFPNLFSGYHDLPPFTNYAVDFIETLDYILASEPNDDSEVYGFGPAKSAPMPSSNDIKKYVAMPNEFMPSDHVSMLCDLEWKRRRVDKSSTNLPWSNKLAK